jgi:hypothetical protein
MNGRVLANAGVFALGIILIVGGAWGMARGSAYVQLEWGWSSVISGSVAFTGGVLTLAVGCVLQRLDALQGALHRAGVGASIMVQPAEVPVAEEPATEPMPLGVGPVTLAAREPEPPPAAYADPALQAAAAINLELLAHEQHPAATEHADPHPSPQFTETASSEPPPEVIHAADQGPADDMVKAAGVSDEPELDAAIEELLAEERGRTPQSAAEFPPAAAVEPAAELPEPASAPEPDKLQKAAQRAGGWRGLFSRKERGASSPPPTDQPAVEPAWEDQALQAPLEPEEPASAPAHKGVPSPAVHGDSIPRTGDDWFDRALSGLDETYEPSGRGAPKETSHEREREDVTHSKLEADQPAAEEPPGSAPPAEPAVIGRYTSGSTTYVMFADGSIEAETPNGVLHFASLADLKVYVEGGH